MPLPTGYAGAFEPVNVAGVLFSKTDTRTPLFNSLGEAVVRSRQFIVGSDYELGAASQPSISETASITAPTPSYTARTQMTNVTQIFQRSVAITYRKLSDIESLSGINLAGQSNNVPSERAFQIAGRLAEIRNDIEYTIINGQYNLASNADQADRTRGLIEAITTNVVDANGSELTGDVLIEVARKLASKSPYGLNGIVGILNAEQLVQLNKLITNEGQRISARSAGANLMTYLTPFGALNFLEGGHRYMPNGTAVFANLSICRSVLNPVPGKGTFFYEPLSKTGAAETGQIYGQWGLDHGHEWMHAKVIDLATTTSKLTAPQVFVTNSATSPVYTHEVV